MTFIELTSASGILASSCFILLIIQLTYAFGVYYQLHRHFKKQKEKKQSEDFPPLSVILVTKDASKALEENLPLILEQDYPQFEVIVIHDKSAGEDENVLKLLGNKYHHLYYSFIPETARYVSRKKLGIAMGIKASRHEWIVVTEPQCKPVSNQWLKGLASHFSPGTDIVLGYSNYMQKKESFARRIRLDNMFQAMRYLGRAANGHPYMGIGRNLAYRKSLYLGHKGFASQLNLQRGDDDLFINSIANPMNTKVALSPDSFIRLPVPSYKRVWFEDKVNALVTGHFYQGHARLFNSIETWTCALFHLLTFIGLTYCILEKAWIETGIIGVGWLIRFISFMAIMKQTSTDLQENFCCSLPLFDLIRPLYSLQIKLQYWLRDKSDFLRK